MTDPSDPFESLPEALVDRLGATEDPLPPVPDAADRAVLDAARAHFAGRGAPAGPLPFARRRPWLTFGLPLAAAAVIAFGLFAIQTSRMIRDLKDGLGHAPTAFNQTPSSPPSSPLAPGGHAELAWDIDRSGKLDILDVYLLAKRREAGDETISPAILDSLCDRVVSLDRPAATGLPLRPDAPRPPTGIACVRVHPSVIQTHGGNG